MYPAAGLVESANLSVGRGTPTPFEVVGAPWISGARLADYLSKRQLKGIAFEPVTFVPAAAPTGGNAARECGSEWWTAMPWIARPWGWNWPQP